ncbi:GNAT family N-acetyltransferase [Novispirillum itersonii]|uniref:GNAT family N-acetyltransferase n=1 Tax=Novispirillum itersonii TaxID=189 RepID=UPI000362594F|nr:GNAT family N-acetyltransferase [Novispirillum itersonii]
MTFTGLIRCATPDDFPCLLDLWLRASRHGHPFLSAEQIDRQYQLVRDVYIPKAEMWVTEEEGRLTGFVALLDHLVGGLFVDPHDHGRGIGRALIAHALTLRGHLLLGVYTRNEGAVAFYRRLGFTEVGRQPHDDDGLPFEVMAMALIPPDGQGGG